jgi:hypothetical protein
MRSELFTEEMRTNETIKEDQVIIRTIEHSTSEG